MSITNVWIEEGCIACGLCEEICPDVFKVEDEAIVIESADYKPFEAKIIEAADNCPVEVIKYD